MTSRRLALAAVAACVLGVAEPVLAIPAFARRYDVECHFCHQGYPKLNALGQRFKERGFRLEREDDFDLGKWSRSVPFILRSSGRYDFVDNGDSTTSLFLKPVSAGNLGKRLSYWVDTGFLIQDDDFTHTKPDNAWARLDILESGKLYAKAGRFELDIPFTQSRTPHLFSYDIYFANTGLETDNLGSFQEGLELGGGIGNDIHWSAAVVRGHNSKRAEELSDEAGKFDANVYIRASRRLEKNRLGLFGYYGRNKLVLERGTVWDDHILRLGADASLWVQKLNLYGVAMYGRNDNSVATRAQPSGTEEPLSFGGGFLQADYHVRDEVALTLRLNILNGPVADNADDKQTLTGLFPGLQFWAFQRLKLSFEYGFLNKERPSYGAIQVEVAF